MGIDAKSVKELREKTGLPMMECKQALEKADGDISLAIDELRKSGAKAEAKLAGRKAEQGLIGSYVSEDGKLGALVSVCCETEPVANNEDFQKFVQDLVEVIRDAKPADKEALLAAPMAAGGSVKDGVTELINRLRENITIGNFSLIEADAVVQYVHFDNRKAAMVGLAGGSTSDEQVATLGKDLGMHVVFSVPQCLSRDKLDPEIIAKEKEIRLAAAQNDEKNANKPEEILEKIVDGQINKFIAGQCFLEQEFIRDEEKRSVEASVEASGTGVSVIDYCYIATDTGE
ncbi:MAG: translation elongation factor Ts [Planctomycetota bacterium]|nr:translation elongation factor Ts [Planctomycetota bacterium]|tara:strand:- start:658 stop:1521 length:864 start_codon:yes stop_codon:yes gene_type:complete